MKTKSLISFSFLAMFSLTFTSCFLFKVTPPVQLEAITFDYTAKTSNAPSSADFVFALVQPEYAKDFKANEAVDLYRNFRKSMGGDFEELLIAKGFRLKGPYDTRDEMLYSDKKTSHMMLAIEIVPEFTPTGQWRKHKDYVTNNYNYSYSGMVTIGGKINMHGIEPLTGEKIWAKSVAIPSVSNIVIATQQRYNQPNGNSLVVMKDPGVYNPIGKALSQVYGNILSKAEAHFSPEEFVALKSQIASLKSKKIH